MIHIAIVSGSIRTGRKSHRVAMYFRKYLEEQKLAIPEILDLMEFQFPLFEERLPYQPSPSALTLSFAEKLRKADGVILVSPEYNGGYPASVKNVIDLMTADWRRKPIAIVTVSDGDFGGTQVLVPLQFSLWKIKAWTVPAMFPVPRVNESFDENGNAMDKVNTDKRASLFINELLWCVEARKRMAME